LEARLAVAKTLEGERTQGIGKEGFGAKLLRDEIVAEDIADVISVLDSEKSKVLAMGSKLRERVVGQDEAIDVVTQSIQH
jgi:ATP-dependent Clp protease ATP-binding subunit ClpB